MSSQNAAPKKKGHRPCDMCRKKKSENATEESPATIALSTSSVAHISREQWWVPILTDGVSSDFGASNAQRRPVVGGSQSPSDSTSNLPAGVHLVTGALERLNHPFPVSHSDDLTFDRVAESLEFLSLNNSHNNGFQGKSSHVQLIKAAVDLQAHAIPAPPSPAPPLPSTPWSIKPWEHLPPTVDYSFPSEDLMSHLISLYFSCINYYLPLLHRPSFETAVATKTHLSNGGFAKTLLLVCSLGARYSEDPRVLEGPVGTAGWKWFEQVKLTLYGQPTLYDLQCYCLAAQFLERASGLRASWTLVGFGIRLGQDIAAHRRKPRPRRITIEEELEKRAYWILIFFDVQLGITLGRSIAIDLPDYDLELPERSDDEYWESSPDNATFCHPKSKPSLIDFFNCQLNLNRIRSFALKVLYAANRSKVSIGLADEAGEERIVAAFHSTLEDTWLNSVPEHLRWDPAHSNENENFFDQSVALRLSYHSTQILIHRPWIPAIRPSESSKSFRSLIICNEAARACSRIAEMHHQRRPHNPLMFGQTAVFTAGLVLLLNMWGSNRGGDVQDGDMADVHRCMAVLRGYTDHWSSAGPLLQTLEQLLRADRTQPVDTPCELSPFAASDASRSSGGSPSTQPLSGNGDLGLGVPSSHSWSTPLDTSNDAYAMANHTYGPGEAPARAPRVDTEGSRPVSAGVNIPTFLDTFAFPDAECHPTSGNNTQVVNTVAMWSAAPSGFEATDWDLYLTSFGHMGA
ncbi:fungal-specific transcription factor domain-containing protein [Mycena galopus ATCC 62051]|nr:fungal-specific transcription factor domain-containing protein [Mycena galopus ATCC 62051]